METLLRPCSLVTALVTVTHSSRLLSERGANGIGEKEDPACHVHPPGCCALWRLWSPGPGQTRGSAAVWPHDLGQVTSRLHLSVPPVQGRERPDALTGCRTRIHGTLRQGSHTVLLLPTLAASIALGPTRLRREARGPARRSALAARAAHEAYARLGDGDPGAEGQGAGEQG